MSLTHAALVAALHYDPETGIFARKVDSRNRMSKAGDVVGHINDKGYISISLGDHHHAAHRLAWLYMTGRWPTGTVDHRDTVRTNNQWDNLRDVSRDVNMQNQQQAHANNKVGLLGVYLEKNGKFRSCIQIPGTRRKKHLGTHETALQAHAAYVAAKRQLHEGCLL
jgi:hypothetical protein